tara:strand:- start:46 stop:477 length:432 start_codon:yes stop_codon:yes gene_type:complete
MKNSILFLSLIFLWSCKSQEFKLEKTNDIKLKEGFYKVIPPAIAEGSSSIKVTLNFSEFDKTTIELVGFYFQGHFISMKEVTNPYGIEGSVPEKTPTIDEDFPFELEPFEVVLSYKKDNKVKYAKYKVKKKVSLGDVPMSKSN